MRAGCHVLAERLFFPFICLVGAGFLWVNNDTKKYVNKHYLTIMRLNI